MKTIRTSPVLKSKAKTGKTTYWQVSLLQEGTTGHSTFFLQKTWWQDGSVRSLSTPEQVVGKNAGRANATSDFEQASLEFDRVIKKRRDRGFSESGSAAHVYIKPMLAHKFEAGSVKFPVLVQPKLDGFRMLMDGFNAWTRGGKDHVHECIRHLIFDTDDMIIDGELLLPGNVPLQVTASAAKKHQRGVSETLEYHVYDIVDEAMPFGERSVRLAELIKRGSAPNVRLVRTEIANNEEDLMALHGEFVAQGYEGSIIRAVSGRYEIGYRSHGLLKLKDFQDAEFKVVDVEHGKGSYEDKAILVLEAKPGVTFNAVPEGNAEYRRDLWKNRTKLIGQVWTVRYQTLSKEGKPVFPVAVAPRSKGD